MRRFSKSTRAVGWLAAAFLSIPILYLLSTGPMSFLWRTLDWDKSSIGDAVAAFYSPLEPLIAESNSALADGLRMYLRVWGEDIPEPGVATLAPPASAAPAATVQP